MTKTFILTKKDVLNYLQTQRLMSIATAGDHPWIASVFYSFDQDLNIYFLTNPKTLHGQHLIINKYVAASVVDSTQKPSDVKKGLQIYGIVEPVSVNHKIAHALRLWKDFLNISRPDISLENMKKGLYKGKIYRLKPLKIKLFDQQKFKVPDGEEPILML
ncbi:hypothetical protein A3J15_00125 [Candidatus Roizmanbacteria bacterium RIFCSPLOWO2_02_FULL_38_10]|uniref:Uncharacterized protein n=1 Tax=Candidatus Roizmanbacteria bacterium RIFCSPLOWO2_02_FULL_38_10 TaxID=1802074 RepID=A0A1F7JNE0_9BACT|nr:MAG: hypothetical protein A3J15_00125 [Candidatus Roizmanbacteria bacterium RIFCSPLOWO2_02_FULL_38_10]